MLGIYVDDGIIASTKPGYIEDILTYLESAFKVVRGGMEYFIGYQIDHDPSTGSIFIHQTQYINDILLRFGLQHAHSLTTPADKHAQLSNRDDLANPLVNVLYKEAIGCLMYAAMLTRPDISFATSKVAYYQATPRQSHWTATKRIY